jgi:hypothetical protein
MHHIHLRKTLAALAHAGFNPRLYMICLALGSIDSNRRDPRFPYRTGDRRP